MIQILNIILVTIVSLLLVVFVAGTLISVYKIIKNVSEFGKTKDDDVQTRTNHLAFWLYMTLFGLVFSFFAVKAIVFMGAPLG